ncbi:MAG: Fic family protein [Victivallales bacterium]
MKRSLQGKYIVISTVGETVRAFVPNSLPPDPPLEISPVLQKKLDEAVHSLGRLDGMAGNLPDINLFLYMFVRKEAVLSSKIEGTQSSLSDLLLFEANEHPGVPLNDVREVSNYVEALDYGLERMQNGFPLSLRLLREIHGKLLVQGRGSAKTPGEFRHSQNWIGGTRPGNAVYVPPPAELAIDCMNALELFLHDENVPLLIKAALSHVQLETIHPFLDGNGRVGRLMITLLLCHGGLLKHPLLYLSYYFKTHRQFYYELLNDVRISGEWERWLDFFAEAVIETAKQSISIIKEIENLIGSHRLLIRKLGKSSSSAEEVFQVFLKRPISGVASVKENTGLTDATINSSLRKLTSAGILEEISGKKRNRLFCYSGYLKILNGDE